jgi:hypothetical protein
MQLTIEIEKIVEYYIASKFIKEEDKITELIITIISPHIIFSKKIEIFCYLISVYDKWFIDKHTGINAALNTIKEERNRFAHWSLDFSPNAQETFINKKGITLVKLKSVKPKDDQDILTVERFLYTVDRFNELISVITVAENALLELTNLQTPPSG